MNNAPVSKQERISELDVFRGFAIFGIFMVNILVMNVSFLYRGEWEAEQSGWLQQASLFVLENLFYSKFFTIFSFLFGIGVAMQIERAKEKGTFRNAFFIRRFAALFLIGILHILLIWAGDILHLYGMLGFLLLIFFRLPAKGLLVSALIVFAFPLYSEIFELIVTQIGFDHSAPLMALSRADILDLKHNGSYLSGMMLRLKEYAFVLNFVYAGITPIALSMMLLGGYIVKAGWLKNIQKCLLLIRWPLFIAFAVLMIYRVVLLTVVVPHAEIAPGSALSIILMTFYQLSDISISFVMLWLVGFFWNKGWLRMFLSPLRYVGRMALSNYILQSIAGYLIMRTFNGYEYFSVFQCILLVVVIYSIQVLISKAWLRRFRFGPLEWLWRSVSYMQPLSIKTR